MHQFEATRPSADGQEVRIFMKVAEDITAQEVAQIKRLLDAYVQMTEEAVHA